MTLLSPLFSSIRPEFNNPEDLRLYPRTREADNILLAEAGCDAVFIPDVEVMYPKKEKGHWDFGLLSSTLEGFYRPGHFDGVLTIVKKLFNIVEPARVYFGEKDFQTRPYQKNGRSGRIAGIHCLAPYPGDPGGLAMSSRNMRLNPEEYASALHISRVLFAIKELKKNMDPTSLEIWGRVSPIRFRGYVSNTWKSLIRPPLHRD